MSKKNVGIVLDKEFYSDIRVRKEADILAKMVLMYLYCAIVSKITTIAILLPIEVTSIKQSKKVKNILFFFFKDYPYTSTYGQRKYVNLF